MIHMQENIHGKIDKTHLKLTKIDVKFFNLSTPFNELGTEGPSPNIRVFIQHPPEFTMKPKSIYIHKLGENVFLPCSGTILARLIKREIYLIFNFSKRQTHG
jgi:hypothetical protein